ncbi:D-xylulose 5-phosphate/D-fructose 6-phosphate phosphoketolase [Sistotremastrum suecicum HHB10207 ss-3]|uniref:D-xylulose 5-phosphate/D-fructose 6-phosphate phosphoketolase n=1 Tax=Sistotremastrum suecicum HHB10207 ss-3 TaxID=1314776 RepID=A0A166EG56_9AGAM|nr:D-xylulose 5-phosphate/D-fructose 6-phosphate phosphoketolase [Sistotremastrum suecicum HHB10207 ss-3]
MPGQELYQPNPPPEASLLPDSVLELQPHVDKEQHLDPPTLAAIKKYRRAALYITAAMIYLKENTLLERDLKPEDIKPRLLGHWGTCPGLILAYAHLNLAIKRHNLNMLFVTGPGHGAPAILSCLWLENSLAKFIPKYSRDRKGLHNLISGFSSRGGFPSHINAETPGSIHEGGELGYALAVSFGAVMDKPDLIVACVIGDGEAETGPTATAWHGYKYLDPAESGAVLPILHVNGFKISERTIFGCMDDKEIISLFSGYGYQVRIVEDLENIDQDLAASIEWAIHEIKRIQKAARTHKPIVKPRWPVIILRTPKGWSGPKELNGKLIEGSFASHQVPLTNVKTDKHEFSMLKEWLESYDIHSLLQKHGEPIDEIQQVIPWDENKRMGMRKETYDAHAPLELPLWSDSEVKKGSQESCMEVVGGYLLKVVASNPKTFRIFSPDELVSNKLFAVLEAPNSGRNFQWDIASRNKGGRVVEVLSEHTCQGMLQGYTLTGRTGLFPSYEAFLGIVGTMCAQYAKFVKMARETDWRRDISSINYVETSTWTRQEQRRIPNGRIPDNGFSHQNPSFIGSILALKASIARVYLPPDANCFLSTVAHCLRAKHYVNLMVGSKQPTPVWLSAEEADKHCIAGASVWKFASTDGGVKPDVVLVGIGVEVTFEVIAAAALLRKLVPELRVRVVNVTDLMILSGSGSHPHALDEDAFDALFTKDAPIHFNYHGYPIELRGLLFGRKQSNHITIEGYKEEGTTTTPFDMLLCNNVSRFDVAIAAVRGGATRNPKVQVVAHQLIAGLKHEHQKAAEYARANGIDPPETFVTPVFH